jgi:hypothetical protein
VKLTPLLATPLAFTTTFPVVAPLGTAATMLVKQPTRNSSRRSSRMLFECCKNVAIPIR